MPGNRRYSINPADSLKGGTDRMCSCPWGKAVSQPVTSRSQLSIFRNINGLPKQLKLKPRLRLDLKPINSSSKHKGNAALRQEADQESSANACSPTKEGINAPDGSEQRATSQCTATASYSEGRLEAERQAFSDITITTLPFTVVPLMQKDLPKVFLISTSVPSKPTKSAICLHALGSSL